MSCLHVYWLHLRVPTANTDPYLLQISSTCWQVNCLSALNLPFLLLLFIWCDDRYSGMPQHFDFLRRRFCSCSALRWLWHITKDSVNFVKSKPDSVNRSVDKDVENEFIELKVSKSEQLTEEWKVWKLHCVTPAMTVQCNLSPIQKSWSRTVTLCKNTHDMTKIVGLISTFTFVSPSILLPHCFTINS